MFKFKSKVSQSLVGIYSIFDPKIPDHKFSPPFFSSADDVALSALCETLRRHHTSYEQVYSSDFLRMDLYRIGSVDLDTGKVISSPKHRYKVVNVGDHLHKGFVMHYMKSVPYPSESEITKDRR